METTEMHIASLGFFLNYGDGKDGDEVELEIFKVMLQNKGEVHYDRVLGGSFSLLEQEPMNSQAVSFLITADMVESVYRVNQEKQFDPYIIVSSKDLNFEPEGKAVLNVEWRLLQDFSITGIAEL